MTKEQAAVFINALNAVYPYVPPAFFVPLQQSSVVQLALAVANGIMVCETGPVLEKPAEQAD